MNILILVASFPPRVNSAARLYSELSESLRKMGHSVTVITEQPPEDGKVDKEHDYYKLKSSRISHKGVNVFRVSSLSSFSNFPGGKAFRFILSGLLFLVKAQRITPPDVILVYSPPLYMGIVGYIISILKRSRFVFNLQDIHPKVLMDMGVIENPLLIRILSKMEYICYKKAHSFIVYSSGNKDYLLTRNVAGRVFIIPNWVDTTITASSDRNNVFRRENGIGNKFVISYVGSMGEPQGLEIVVETAMALQNYKDILFLIAGEGPSKPLLQKLIIERNLKNIRLLPMMLKSRYVQFINAADVCLITLSPEVPLQTVPGKLADILACGKPIIAAINQQGDAAAIIKRAECGLCVQPGNVEAFSRAVLKIYRNEGLRKEMGDKGREFAEKYYSRSICTKQYEEVLFSAFENI